MNRCKVRFQARRVLVVSWLLILNAETLASDKAEEPRGRANLSLSLDREKYEVGEPIVANVALTNSSKQAFKVDRSSDVTGMIDGYSFQVSDDKGKPVPLDGPGGRVMHAIGSSDRLEPGEVHRRKFFLNYHMRVLEPGNYSARCTFKPLGSKEGTGIASPEVRFQVVKTAPAELEKRISSLQAQLRAEGDARSIAPLLRFTGQPQAFKVLVEMLYAKEESRAASAAAEVPYFKKDLFKKELIDSIKTRGPRYHLVQSLFWVRPEVAPEIVPLLIPWLEDNDADARAGALEGLRGFGTKGDPALFPRLAARLKDPEARVRQLASAVVGQYRNADALRALKSALDDPDKNVIDQATSAIGWVALAAPPGSLLREDARTTLVKISKGPPPAASGADYWLKRLEEGK